MPVYKFTFANNAVLSCTETRDKTVDGESYYEHHNGYLIYAFVKAEDETHAKTIAERIIDQFKAGSKQ